MSRDRRRPRRRDRQQRSGTRTISLGPPIVIGVGVIAVVALIAFLIIQAGGSDDEDWGLVEACTDLTLPGECVELAEIYGEAYPGTAGHVSFSVDYEAAGNSNPPVGGPHWNGPCGEDPSAAPAFCGPAPWGIYTEEWDPETLVHNMEHGGAILWYNTTDEDLVDEMQDDILDLVRDLNLIVMAPYSDMEDETIALTSWSRIDKFPVGDYTEERLKDFMETHVRRFNPEHF